jgi:hypothetical protein
MKEFKSYIMSASLVVLAIYPAAAQQRDPVNHSSTSMSAQGRYEVVQSTLAARWTFRVDRTCGRIHQLVSTQDSGGVAWEEMTVLKMPKCSNDGKIRYQVFTSGLAARHTFLMNTDTGKTWQIQTSKDAQGNESAAWVPFDE